MCEKDIRNLPKNVIGRVIKAIEKLQEDPVPKQAKKIKGSERSYRLRVGDYRIIYQVDKERKKITIYLVRSRESVYEKI